MSSIPPRGLSLSGGLGLLQTARMTRTCALSATHQVAFKGPPSGCDRLRAAMRWQPRPRYGSNSAVQTIWSDRLTIVESSCVQRHTRQDGRCHLLDSRFTTGRAADERSRLWRSVPTYVGLDVHKKMIHRGPTASGHPGTPHLGSPAGAGGSAPFSNRRWNGPPPARCSVATKPARAATSCHASSAVAGWAVRSLRPP